MKKGLVFIVIFVLFVLAGCLNNEYKDALAKGEEAVGNEEYDDAIDYFKVALEAKEKDETAQMYLKQTKEFVEALNVKDADLDKAKDLFEQVIVDDGLTVLNEKSEEYIKEIEERIELLQKLELKLIELEEDFAEITLEQLEEELKDLKTESLNIAAFNQLNEDLSVVEEMVHEVKETNKQIKEDLEEVKSLKENSEYEKALVKIEEVLEIKLKHHSSEGLIKEIKEEKELIKEKQKEIEKKQKEQAMIDNVIGYWATNKFEYDGEVFYGLYDQITETTHTFYYAESDFTGHSSIDLYVEGDKVIMEISGKKNEITIHNKDKIEYAGDIFTRVYKDTVWLEYDDTEETVGQTMERVRAYSE